MHKIPRGTDQVFSSLPLSKKIFLFAASALIFFHPGPPGLVFLQKLINVSVRSGLVKKVTITQIIVVNKTTDGNF